METQETPNRVNVPNKVTIQKIIGYILLAPPVLSVILFLCMLFVFPLVVFGQSYKEWDDHDVVKFYEKIDLDSYTLDEDGEEIGEIYVPTKVEDGTYEVEVYKISSQLYRIQGTNIYMYFRYSPYLYSFDEGVLEVSYNSGTFYEEP